ncbi:hypothetical protein UCRPA7_5256 [Phaeoacremonium minimum UCRPA7]|uniref:Uncharacterized protein n=1 Tax=Phaeoacremonium minimum (strain UCR-PA7) TaxID=1286976 RepID=R8BIW7_PHAM7|nr:hypothetical protein UCRPA7_5256 [Phaeoacremonium minimum UCRPA7]EON99229.1 hypothetical protein UCRPA7_5256 [Phaeoacremonium minimum UCRPA7]
MCIKQTYTCPGCGEAGIFEPVVLVCAHTWVPHGREKAWLAPLHMQHTEGFGFGAEEWFTCRRSRTLLARADPLPREWWHTLRCPNEACHFNNHGEAAAGREISRALRWMHHGVPVVKLVDKRDGDGSEEEEEAVAESDGESAGESAAVVGASKAAQILGLSDEALSAMSNEDIIAYISNMEQSLREAMDKDKADDELEETTTTNVEGDPTNKSSRDTTIKSNGDAVLSFEVDTPMTSNGDTAMSFAIDPPIKPNGDTATNFENHTTMKYSGHVATNSIVDPPMNSDGNVTMTLEKGCAAAKMANNAFIQEHVRIITA